MTTPKGSLVPIPLARLEQLQAELVKATTKQAELQETIRLLEKSKAEYAASLQVKADLEAGCG